MSVLGVFEIGRTALAAQTAAIGVTGENIANVNTLGYSRQRAILEAVQVDPYQKNAVGNGVNVATIQRTYDRFLQAQINSAKTTSGEQSTLQSALQQIEPLFGDLTGNALGTSMQSFFSAWQDLAMNPQGAAERQSILAKAQTLIDEFHQISSSLNGVKTGANQSLPSLTSEINTITSQIAALNSQIKSADLSGGNANVLRDNRDQLILNLSQKVGIATLEQPDGMVNVSLAGGPQLVVGDMSAAFALRDDPNNSGFSSIILNPPGGGTGTDVTPLLYGTNGSAGELGGTLQIRDVLVNSYLTKLDELAGTLATQVNSVHAAGFGLNGSTGVNFFTQPAAPVPPATVTAGFSSSIALNVTSTDAIAAATTDPTLPGNGGGNNINALALADLGGKAFAMTGGSDTLSGFYQSLVGNVGLTVLTLNQDSSQNTALINQLNIYRDSSAGVSLDEELIALTKYQKAFQGAARLITTGQEMMDTVLNMVR